MIRLVDDPDNFKILISISGEKFADMLDYIKGCGHATFAISYSTDEHDHAKVWVVSYFKIAEVLRGLSKIEFVDPNIIENAENLKDCVQMNKPVERRETGISPIRSQFRLPPLGDYQFEDIETAIATNRVYFAWEMRLGKTYAVITTLNHWFAKGLIDSVLIVVPPEGKYTFMYQLIDMNTFGIESEDDIYMFKLHESENPFDIQGLPTDKKVIIMTYGNVVRLNETWMKKKGAKKLKKKVKSYIPFDNWGTTRAIVCDEAHNLRNYESKKTQVLMKSKEHFEYRVLMSGTPAPNHVYQLYPQLNFLDESIINNTYENWIQSIANVGTKWSALGINYYYADKVKKFMESCKDVFLRRFQKDSLPNLSPMTIVKEYSNLESEHLELYRQFVEYNLDMIKEDNDGVLIPRKVKDSLPYIKLMIDNPCLVDHEKIDPKTSGLLKNTLKKWKFEKHSKLEVVDSLLEKSIEEEDKRMIIWSGHPMTLNQLAERYSKYSPTVIHGQIGSDPKERHLLLENWKKSKNKLLLASYMVLSTAVDISVASRAVFFDLPEDLVFFLQAVQRIAGPNQKEPSINYTLIAGNTFETMKEESIDFKTQVNDNIFNKEELPLEEWKRIFNGRKKKQ